jgi:hypothetical protein
MPSFKRETHKIVSVFASVERHHAALNIFTVEDFKLPVTVRPRLAEGDCFVVLTHAHNLPHISFCSTTFLVFYMARLRIA